MSLTRAYNEILDFIAAGSSSQSVSEFRPSEEIQSRVMELLERVKSETLTSDEASELEHYLQLEHLMRLAKARDDAMLVVPGDDEGQADEALKNVNLAEALKGWTGLVSFEPADLSEDTGKKFADLLAEKHQENLG